LIRRHPGRFIGAALVALQDVGGAIREMEWAFQNGFKTAVLDYVYPVREHPCGEPLGSRRELWPFFERAAELGMPLVLHLNMEHGHRSVNLMKFQREGLDIFAPKDDQMNLVSLITSGLLDDFPSLQFIHTESGTAWIRPLVERLDSIFERPDILYEDDFPTHRPRRRLSAKVKPLVAPEVASEKNKRRPSYYFRNNLFFTIETEEAELAGAVRFLGAGRFLFATDYPHDDPGGSMKFRDLELLAANAEISERDKELIRCENAKKLFGL
jgi:predicted TIM-barrel fold metal-dependent hydrolase